LKKRLNSHQAKRYSGTAEVTSAIGLLALFAEELLLGRTASKEFCPLETILQ
jgi:hypothetical protein